VLHHQFPHWKVARVAGRQPGPYAESGGGDKAVGLTEGDPSGGKLTSPQSRLFSLAASERGDAQTVEQVCDGGFLGRLDSTKQLFHVDRTYVGTVTRGPQPDNPAC